MSVVHTFGRLISGIWRGMNGVRKFLHLVLLVFIFSIILSALSGTGPSTPDEAALVINPVGNLVEQLDGDPFERAVSEAMGNAVPQTLVQDLIDTLKYARDDDRIKAVVLDLRSFGRGSIDKLARVGAAIDEVKAAGKPVFSYADGYSQHSYYLASHADEVLLHPEGMVFLQGYGRYSNYFKDAIDKLLIDWNVFKVGTHKSYVEPYTRMDMSPEDREASGQVLDELWSTYVADVAAQRGMDSDMVRSFSEDLLDNINASSGDLAQSAVDNKLVDGLLNRVEFNEKLIALVGADKDDEGMFSAAFDSDYLDEMRMFKGPKKHEKNVAVIVASGEILDGVQPPGAIGGDSTAAILRKARFDKSVQAVVLRVDSGGGSAFASEVIREEILALKKAGKPVVASMGGVAASGGYWISMGTDKIYASSSTITGSIGILGMFPTFQRSLAALGIATDGLGTTQWAGELRADRAMSDNAKKVFQALINKGYDDFISRVSEHRGIEKADVDKVAQGKIWTGTDALEHGLIDEIGGLDEAVAGAAALAKLEEGSYGRKLLEKDLTPGQRLAMQLMGDVRWAGLGFSAVSSEQQVVSKLTQWLGAELLPVTQFNDPKGLYLKCFCEIQ